MQNLAPDKAVFGLKAEKLVSMREAFGKNPINLLALLSFIILLLTAISGPLLVPYNPLETNAGAILQSPSLNHWFGTDQLGRDIFSRVIVATRLDMAIAFGAVLISLIIGSVIGVMIGYFGGRADGIAGRLTDILMAFPLFVLAMVMVAALGNSVMNIILVTAIINLPFYIRLARSEVKVRLHASYIDAARIGGSGHRRILMVFLLPAMFPVLIVQASVNLGWSVLNAAGLSFLGLGIQPPTAEWGVMIAEGAQFMLSGQWWVALFPGLALMIAVLTFNLLGDGLRDISDPELRL